MKMASLTRIMTDPVRDIRVLSRLPLAEKNYMLKGICAMVFDA